MSRNLGKVFYLISVALGIRQDGRRELDSEAAIFLEKQQWLHLPILYFASIRPLWQNRAFNSIYERGKKGEAVSE